MKGPAPEAGLGTGLVRAAGHLWEATEVEGNTVTTTELLWLPLIWYQIYMVRSPHIELDGCSLAVVCAEDHCAYAFSAAKAI